MNVAYLMYEAERETANDPRPSSILGSFPATGYDIDELIREFGAAADVARGFSVGAVRAAPRPSPRDV